MTEDQLLVSLQGSNGLMATIRAVLLKMWVYRMVGNVQGNLRVSKDDLKARELNSTWRPEKLN